MNKKNQWTHNEIRHMKTMIKKQGITNWAKITKELHLKFGTRLKTIKQCSGKWRELNRNCKKRRKLQWTKQQDRVLFQKHRQIGNHWKDLAKYFTNKSPTQIKNHFFSAFRKRLRRINKLMGIKKGSKYVNSLKPTILSAFNKLDSQQKSLQSNQQLRQILQILAKNDIDNENEEISDQLLYVIFKKIQKYQESLNFSQNKNKLKMVSIQQSDSGSQMRQQQIQPKNQQIKQATIKIQPHFYQLKLSTEQQKCMLLEQEAIKTNQSNENIKCQEHWQQKIKIYPICNLESGLKIKAEEQQKQSTIKEEKKIDGNFVQVKQEQDMPDSNILIQDDNSKQNCYFVCPCPHYDDSF